MPTEITTRIHTWAGAADISARSVLVTIIGDTLVPIRSSLWMSQMLRLSNVFGFNDRLVRTSMNRLVAEEWLFTERVGRQSRYHLTDLAFTESARAADRIYGVDDADWSGEWVLLFVPNTVNAAQSSRIVEHFRWHGYVPVSAGVMAGPGAESESTRELLALVDPDLSPVIATATFDELAELVESGFFLAETDGRDQARAYSAFVDRYEPMLNMVKKADPVEAFGLRTMVIHDLRRIRLRWPELPVQARPVDWPGVAAADIASQLYETLVSASANWLSDVFDTAYPLAFPGRFATTHELVQRTHAPGATTREKE